MENCRTTGGVIAAVRKIFEKDSLEPLLKVGITDGIGNVAPIG